MSIENQLANPNETSATFTINEEDHTLGNSLRYVLSRNPETTFVGYSVPHPSEKLINLRLQTRGMTDMIHCRLIDRLVDWLIG